MSGLSRHHALNELRIRIRHIEKRPPLLDIVQRGENLELFNLPAGQLHEVFTDAARNSGAAFGFALAAAKNLQTAERPAILIVQLIGEGQDKGIPYGLGIKSFGFDPQSLIVCRPETSIELLWAIEEAIACRAVAAVIADIGSKMKALDFTASRRLALRSASGGSSVFLLRYGLGREASASRFRWRVDPALSGDRAFDARAPGATRWRVELEKGWSGTQQDSKDWLVEWTQDGFALVKSQTGPGALAARDTPLSGAEPAALGNRLPKAG